MGKGKFWVGLDCGFRQSQVCITNSKGKPKHELKCETTINGIKDALSVVPRKRIGLIAAEAGIAPHALRLIKEAKYPIALFDARKASKFLAVRRNKSDASDARGLADLARIGRHTVSQVYVKSLKCERLRARLVMRQRIVKMRVAAEAALRSQLAYYGAHLETQKSAEQMREQFVSHMKQLKAAEAVDLEEELMPLIDICQSLRRYQRSLDRAFEREAKEHPVCARLMRVYGVGPICSLSFYTAIEKPDRFKRASDVAAYLGLVPRRYQSGDTSYTKGITKTGSKMTRTHLVIAATAFATRGPDSALKQWAADLRKRAGSRRTHVALARKLSILLLTIWRDAVSFEPYPIQSCRAATDQRRKCPRTGPREIARSH